MGTTSGKHVVSTWLGHMKAAALGVTGDVTGGIRPWLRAADPAASTPGRTWLCQALGEIHGQSFLQSVSSPWLFLVIGCTMLHMQVYTTVVARWMFARWMFARWMHFFNSVVLTISSDSHCGAVIYVVCYETEQRLWYLVSTPIWEVPFVASQVWGYTLSSSGGKGPI